MIKRAKAMGIVGFCLLLFSSVMMVWAVSDQSVQAAPPGVFSDRSNIAVGDQSFVDSDIDDTFNYIERDPADECADIIRGFNNDAIEAAPNLSPSSATYVYMEKSSAGMTLGTCLETKTESIALSGNFGTAFLWQNKNSIRSSDANRTYTREGDTNVFREGTGECTDTLTIYDPNNLASAYLFPRQQGGRGAAENQYSSFGYDYYQFNIRGFNIVASPGGPSGCVSPDLAGSGLQVVIGNAANAAIEPPPADGSSEENGGGLNCSSEGLAWIICPIIEGIDKVTSELDKYIENQLTINVTEYLEGENGNGFREIWSSVRTLALSILVLAALVMVISQALQIGPFDAYTVRKIMPRLLVSIILISISWELTRFIIEFSNDLGRAVKDIIQAPFYREGENLNIGGAGVSWIGSLATGATFLALGLWAVLSFAVTALLAILIAFAVLLIRQVLVIFLVVLAPIAIACYILPNTEKVWKLWWDTFIKTLMLFPIIAAFIAIGKVFAKVSLGVEGSSPDFQHNAIALVAYIAPYFALPFAFRLAGGAIGTIAGLSNDRSRGAFDRLKKYRAEQPGERLNKARAGELYSGSKFIPGSRRAAGRVNAMTRGLGTGSKGNFGLGAKGATANHAAIETTANGYVKTDGFQTIANNDDALHAGTYDSEEQAREALMSRFNGDETRVNKAINSWKTSGFKFGNRSAQYAAARQLVSTGTGYDDIGDMTRTLARVSHGNSSSASALAGFANAETKQRNRYDLAPGYTVLDNLVQEEAGTTGQSRPTHVAYDTASVTAARGADAVTLIRGKPRQVQNLTGSLQRHLTEQWSRANDTSLNQADRDQALDNVMGTSALITQLDSAKSYGSPENQGHVNNLLDNPDVSRIQGNLAAMIQSNPALQARFDRLSPPPRNPNDPNLPVT